MNVKFAFDTDQNVKIKSTGTIGKVTGCYVNRHKVQQFLVQYADRNDLTTDRYFEADEIEAV